MLAVQQDRKEDILVGVCCVGFCEDVGCINIDTDSLLMFRLEEVVVTCEILCTLLEKQRYFDMMLTY
jgi:hypothetical protein